MAPVLYAGAPAASNPRKCGAPRATTFTASAGAARTTGSRAASRRRLWRR